MALIGEDEIHGFLDDLERQISRAADARYGDLSIDNSISSKNARAEVSDISDELPSMPESVLDRSEQGDTANTWCERSLDQLELTVQLLDQCLDSDLKDLKRQQGIIEMCRNQIDEIKAQIH